MPLISTGLMRCRIRIALYQWSEAFYRLLISWPIHSDFSSFSKKYTYFEQINATTVTDNVRIIFRWYRIDGSILQTPSVLRTFWRSEISRINEVKMVVLKLCRMLYFQFFTTVQSVQAVQGLPSYDLPCEWYRLHWARPLVDAYLLFEDRWRTGLLAPKRLHDSSTAKGGPYVAVVKLD